MADSETIVPTLERGWSYCPERGHPVNADGCCDRSAPHPRLRGVGIVDDEQLFELLDGDLAITEIQASAYPADQAQLRWRIIPT